MSAGRDGRALLRRHGLLAAVLAAYLGTALVRPATAIRAVAHATAYAGEIGVLLLAAYVFLGLFEEWISPRLLARAIGREAGRVRALGVATLAGAFATGPVYVTYPLATLFAGAGARLATIVTFMSSWQIVKLTFLPFEMQFLGVRFTVLRLLCAALVPIPAGLLSEAVLRLLGVRALRAPSADPPAS